MKGGWWFSLVVVVGRRALKTSLAGNARQARFFTLNSRPGLEVAYNTGQPTHETRPHYLPVAGHVTPGISAMEYYQRRVELSRRMPVKSMAILVGNQVQYSSGSVFYDFQQDTDLYYMTGWMEPNSVAVIEKQLDRGNEDDTILHMLVPPKNALVELWEGQRLGLQGAWDFFNADYTEDIDKVKGYMLKLLARNEHVFWDAKYGGRSGSGGSLGLRFSSFFDTSTTNRNCDTIHELLKLNNKKVKPLRSIIEQLRALKSAAEVEVMHLASRISSRAINQAMGRVGLASPIATEKTLAKYLEYQFVKGGCDKQAYIPVVASGPNALTIHYTRNDDLLYRDELVFIDAGGKLGGYCADISRSWPNSPHGFTGPQRDVYEIVLAVNKQCLDLCFATNDVSINDIHDISVNILTKELRKLSGFESVTASDVTRELYPHYIGHHLGLDLHDVPGISKLKKIESGNVVTIEPGLYVPFNDKYPKSYQGIGVRVEDDVVVGKNQHDILNLTSGCVKEVSDIESLVKSGGVTTPGLDDELVVLKI